MTLGRLALLLALVVSRSAVAEENAAPRWFTPPAASRQTATVDMSPGPEPETITVIGRRPDHSWRSKLADEHLNDPRASDAARPRDSFAQEKSYCNNALRTVGGQPANAADMQVGAGAGSC